ncbi:LysR family transcriptional regulator [Paraglaciecola sp.]|uniref:LysR family transcriptional regulator n=1 Tax=Paraglaciecola sp. TaxID=1920173 RepID=UPI0030F46985
MLLESIETLLILDQEKTMSRTASLLYISQSAVSKRIAFLEKKLGKKLVLPEGRHVRLTRDAKQLVTNLGATFHELQGQLFEQRALQDDTIIHLACSETLVAGYLSKIMTPYLEQDPAITISTHHTPRIIEHVQSGKATIGLCAGYLPPQHGLKTILLWQEPFVVISQKKLEQLPAKVITNDLNNPANRYQLDILSNLNIEPFMQMDSYTAAAQLALNGLAPAVVPISTVNTLNLDKQYCYDFTQLHALRRPVNICVRANIYANERIKKLISAIAHVAPITV